ncbi:MAG: hypothetical protein BWK76_15820 [Desulfobulbaceae bacterium A2]|nr:MAG: hypothetical protein BWK76_15820 [Desulfobulbaceae bacterium A2]
MVDRRRQETPIGPEPKVPEAGAGEKRPAPERRRDRRRSPVDVVTEPFKLLFVDDEEINCLNFRLSFEEEFQIFTAHSGDEALKILEREADLAVLLTDQRMPGMTGVELCIASLGLRPDCLRWIVTAYADLEDILAAINKAHIQYYILKPWDTEQIRLLLAQAVRARTLLQANRMLQENLSWRNQQLDTANSKLREAELRLRALSASLIQAQETERRRIALELHDELGQELTALKLGLRLLETNCQEKCSSPEELTANYAELRLQLNRAMENVRRLSQDLSPIQIENLGLDSALDALVESTCRRSGLEAAGSRVPIGALFTLPEQRLIYRMLQEALNNVVKHAAAQRLAVEIGLIQGQITLRVVDDGRGFDARIAGRPAAGQGMGLSALQERAYMLGGRMELASRPGQGTRLEIILPERRQREGETS